MRFQRKKVAVALGYALGVGSVALLAASAHAASDVKVDVTGSNIKRVEGEGALPVQVITREDIQRTGAQNTYELLQLVSANNSAGNVTISNVIGATTFSNTTASLRGLGGSSTLVLINGKRLGTFAGAISGAEGVNLTAIPTAAIERVEVLKDGASAIYGSDAIGGVINFIMRQDFTGVDATVFGGTPFQHGGGDQYHASVTAGWGDLAKDRFNVFISGEYQEQRPLLDKDRAFASTSYRPDIGLNTTSGNTNPGFISTGNIGNPNFPNCAPSIIVGSRCRFDPNRTDGVEALPDTKQINLFGSGRFQINNDWQAYATGMYSEQKTNFQIQPVPISDQVPTASTSSGFADVVLPASSPFYPHALAQAAGVDGQPLNVRWRSFENRNTTDTNDAWQGIVGLKGTAWNWDWDGSFNYSENRVKEVLNTGFYQYSKLLPLLNSGVVNLFGPNTPGVVSQFDQTAFTGQAFHHEFKQYGVDLKGSGEVYQLPAGPLAVAAGGQYYRSTLDQNPNPILNTGDITGYGGSFLPVQHSRNQYAAFAEANVPIVKNLEGDVAVRWDHYSDFGSTTNPKASLRWQPTKQVLFRGAWGTGFLAPSLFQMFNPQVPGLSSPGVSDPLRCPDPNAAGSESNPDCNTQYTATFGGNPNLKPVKSTQTTLGGVWEPLDILSVGVDWFKIDLTDLLTTGIPINTILDPATYSSFSNLVTRENCGAPPCRITAISQTNINLGKAKIQGYDVDIRLTLPPTAWGRVKAELFGTYYSKYDLQNLDGSGTYQGQVSNLFNTLTSTASGVIPRWKHYLPITWDFGPWSATVANTYQSPYADVLAGADGETPRVVGSMSLWDIQGTYSGFKNLKLTVGVKNVFGTNPPLTNSNLTFQSGYDPSYYDPRGAFLYGSVNYAFH
jgi:iron complex outermembrane recepter protein